MVYTLTSVENVGDDVLLVTATNAYGEVVTATGWVSATTNHFDVDAEGNRTSEIPRAMTPEEIGVYALSLLPEEESPQPAQPVQFVAP